MSSHITSEGKWRLKNAATGEQIERWPVDARAILTHEAEVDNAWQLDVGGVEMTATQRFEQYRAEAVAAGYSGEASTGIAEGRLRHFQAGGDGSMVLVDAIGGTATSGEAPAHPLGVPLDTGGTANAGAVSQPLKLPGLN